MTIESLKIDLIHWLSELDDRHTLEELLRIKKKQEKAGLLNEKQKEELDKRLDKYESGEMEFASWDTVKQRVKNR